jgi:hypothetical protein
MSSRIALEHQQRVEAAHRARIKRPTGVARWNNHLFFQSPKTGALDHARESNMRAPLICASGQPERIISFAASSDIAGNNVSSSLSNSAFAPRPAFEFFNRALHRQRKPELTTIALASTVLVALMSCATGKVLAQAADQTALINDHGRPRSAASAATNLFETAVAPSLSGDTPGGPPTDIQCNSGGRFGNCNGVTENTQGNLQTKGQNPVVDVGLYGLYARFSSTACTTTANSPTVTLGSASNFRNGEYVTCYNAGPATTASTPTSVTVTPSVNTGGQGETTNHTNGSTRYAYEVVAEDKYNGRSVASRAASTSAGAASNGVVHCMPKAWSRSGTTVTITTAGCSLVPKQQIWVEGANDPSVNGNWLSISPTNGTTITFYTNFSTSHGGASSGTFSAGQVAGWMVNRITWAYNSANFRYHIYGPDCPTTCNWMGQTVQNFWDDYGSSMEAGQTKPPYIPTAAPRAVANQHLTAQIGSGAGTTSIVLSKSAGASVRSTIVSDDGPALLAAASAASPSAAYANQSVYVPTMAQIPQVNSYTDFSGFNGVHLTLGGNLIVNNTLANISSIDTIGRANGTPSFGFYNAPSIQSNTAYPILFYNGVVAHLHDVTLQFPSGNNGYLGIYAINAVNFTAEGFQAILSTSANDCTGLAALFTTVGNGATSFFFTFKRTLLSGGYCLGGTGTSPFPTVIGTTNVASGGNSPVESFSVDQAWFVNRGGIQIDTQGAPLGSINLHAKDVWTQSLTNSAFSIAGNSGVAAGIILDDVLMADYQAPILTAYHGLNGSIYARNLSANNGVAWYTGGPVAGGILGGTNDPRTGVNNAIVGLAHGTITDGVNWILGQSGAGPAAQFQVGADLALVTNFGIHTTDPPPAAPTCVTVTGGPPNVREGTYTFAYAAAYAPNGGVGNLSPASTSCTANGTSQQMSLTIPTAVPGAIGYYWYVSTGNGFFGLNGSVSTGLTYKWNGIGNGNSQGTLAGGGPAGMQNGKFWGKQIITTGTETTATQCFSSASPAACGSNIDGFVAIPAGSSSVVVDTKAVTANSEISLTFDTTEGRSLGVTCNTRPQQPYISARMAGTSFTISVSSNFVANPGCIGFHLKN